MNVFWRPTTRLALALLIGVLAMSSQWVAHILATDVLETTIRQSEIAKIDTVGNLINGLIQRRGQQARAVARELAVNKAVIAKILDAGKVVSPSIEHEFAEAQRIGQVDLLEVNNAAEIVLHRNYDSQRFASPASGWGVTEALAGASMLASTIGAKGASIWAIEPVRAGDTIIGTVSAGIAFDKAFFAQVGPEVGAQLTLLARKKAAQRDTKTSAENVDDKAMGEAFENKIPIYRVNSESRRTSVYLPVTIIDEAYVILAELDSTAAYQLLEEGKRRSAFGAGATLVVSVLIGLFVLHFAIAPLRRLRSRAERVAVELTGESIKTTSRDEIASVVNVLETLTERFVKRNAELLEAKALAEAGSRAKSQFLSSMSHEIRTPLNGILGLTDLLQGTKLSAEQEHFVQSIGTAGRSLHAVLGDILDLSKIEEGMIVLEKIDFDPAHLAAEIGSVYREIAATRGLMFATDIDAIPRAMVRGDPARIRQVLLNLMNNALKFTKRGAVKLSAKRLGPVTGDARRWWRFTVEDSGVGISAEAQANLFQRFSQADTSTTRNYGGSGLGLSISKHLVDLMDGKIEMHSELGKGSRFWFDLPFEETATVIESAPVTSIAGATADFTGLHALIAEDNPINRLVIESQLKKLGFKLTVAENGALAVERVREETFDIIFMDCLMPVMDGFEATRLIRLWEKTLPSHRATPIIALTANAMTGDREVCIAAGMTDYVPKPISIERLIEVIGLHAKRRAEK